MSNSKPMAPPLPVVETIAKAVVFVWRGRNEFMTLAFPAVLVLSILNTGFARLLLPEGAADLASDAERIEQVVRAGILPLLLMIVPFCFFWTTFAIGWHRRYLLPKEMQSVGQILTWRTRHTRFLLYAVGLTMIVVTVLVVGASIAAFVPVLLVLALAATVVVYARLSQVLPSAAIDHALTFAESWVLTRGQTSRLFAVIVATWFPTAVIIAVLQEILALSLGNSQTLMALFVRAFVGNLMGYLGVALGVSVLSLIYDHLRVGRSPSVDLRVF